MNIKVVAKKNASKTEQGVLLEQLAGLFLRSKGFEVTENIQNAGMELDLLCTNKNNRAKKIYVECKAYDYKTTISSDVIWKIKGIKEHKRYDEAWLVTTAPLGKQAKAVELEISEMNNAGDYTFYTPDKLISSLIDANIITEYAFGKKEIVEIVGDKNNLGEILFLVTPYGNYWATVYVSSGEPTGIIYTDADNGEIIYDDILLQKLNDLEFGFNNCDSNIIIELLQSTREQIEQGALTKLRLNENYLSEILDLGVKISHPHTADFNLEDIYLFPDLEINKETNRKKLNSQSLLGNIDRERYVIFGDELSGKTTLARLLQWRKSISGKVTIILNG
ncbi:MAG: restriction endonuclease, partial [Ignavibacteria bacterium]|nr:restriction endonuclease [Ignavibacteria bacterium]